MSTTAYIAIALGVLVAVFITACNRRSAVPVNESVNDRHNRLYKEACALIDPYMRLHGAARRDATTARARRDLAKGIDNLKTVVQINPDNWAAYWIMGKGYQAQGMSSEACDAFASAYTIQKENADVAREYMFECLNVGRTKEAVQLSRAALALRPQDPGLKANLALCLLVDAQLDEGLRMTEEALQADPSDGITKSVKRIIEEVKSGKRPQPRRYSDLKDVEQ